MNKKLLLVTLLCATGYTLSAQQNMAHLSTELRQAAQDGNSAKLTALLATPGISVSTPDRDGYTALILAAEEGFDNCVQLLLAAHGANINAQNKDGDTALMAAAENGHIACVRLLLAVNGIDINKQNKILKNITQ